MTMQVFRIQDLCQVVRGKYPALKTEPGEYPMVVTAAKRRTASSYQLDAAAVCIPLISSTGHGHASMHRVHYQDGKFALANLLVALIPKDKHLCDAKYLYYLLNARKKDYFVPLMSGTANVSLREKDIADVTIALPSLAEQQQITREIDSYVARIEEAGLLHQAIEREARAMTASALHRMVSNVPSRTMREVAPIVRRPVDIDSSFEYLELGIRSFGNGTFHKPGLMGSVVGSKRLFRIEPGDLIFSNVFAWEGAVAVAGADDAGRYGSHRFITCVPQPALVRAEFLKAYFLTSRGLEILGKASPGGAGRNRTLGVEALQEIQVPVPEIGNQDWFVQLQAGMDELVGLQRRSCQELQGLLTVFLNKILPGMS